MAFLRVIDRDGKEYRVEGKTGLKVMETLRELDYGVAAICGGMCSCATCHVHVDPDWIDRTGTASSMEADMLEMEEDVTKYSRLTCQITVTDELDGLKVTVTGR